MKIIYLLTSLRKMGAHIQAVDRQHHKLTIIASLAITRFFQWLVSPAVHASCLDIVSLKLVNQGAQVKVSIVLGQG